LSAYLSYGLVVSEVLSLKEAQTCVLISGILTGAMALTGLNTVVMNRIPQSVKMGTVIGMGALIALIGMTSVDLVVSNDDTLVALGPMDNIDVIVSLIGAYPGRIKTLQKLEIILPHGMLSPPSVCIPVRSAVTSVVAPTSPPGSC